MRAWNLSIEKTDGRRVEKIRLETEGTQQGAVRRGVIAMLELSQVVGDIQKMGAESQKRGDRAALQMQAALMQARLGDEEWAATRAQRARLPKPAWLVADCKDKSPSAVCGLPYDRAGSVHGPGDRWFANPVGSPCRRALLPAQRRRNRPALRHERAAHG